MNSLHFRSRKISIWFTLSSFLMMQASVQAQTTTEVFGPTGTPQAERPLTQETEPAVSDPEPAQEESFFDDNPLSEPTPEEASGAEPAVRVSAETQEETPPAENEDTSSDDEDAVQRAAVQTAIEEDSVMELASESVVTTLPGRPVLSIFSNEADISIDQESSSSFTLNYDLSREGGFGGAIINFGASEAGPQDLSAIQDFDFEFAVSGDCSGRECVKVEFVDANDQIGIVFLEDLTSTPSAVTITQAELQANNPNLDFTSIKQINFVVDQPLAEPDVGSLQVNIGGLAFTPTVTGTTPAGTPTPLPGAPLITSFSNESEIVVDDNGDGQFQMDYDVSTPGSFAGAIINYGESEGPEDLSAIQTFDFNLRTNNACLDSKCLKIEFVDAAGNIANVNVEGLDAEFRTASVSQAQLLEANPDLNLASIRQINFVIEEGNTDPKIGFVEVQTGGFGSEPGPGPGPEPEPEPGTATITAGASAGTPTILPDTPPVTTFSNESTITVENAGGDLYRFDYDVTTAASFAGGIINYGETPEGFADLSSFGSIDFNMRTDNACLSSKCIKVEFLDANGQLAQLDVQGLDPTLRQVSIPAATILSVNPALDLTRIQQINFVIEEANTNPKAGFLEVETDFSGTTPPPGPTPEPEPSPEPEPTPTDDVLTGITEGQTVTGTVIIQPNLEILPPLKKVAYYLNGTQAGKQYAAPYTWGGEGGFDTTRLSDGEYTLSGYYTNAAGEDVSFSVSFNIENGITESQIPGPVPGAEDAITGLGEGETVNGTITVQPDLEQNPDTHKVFYYLNGTKLEKQYAPPYALTLDTTMLPDGTHTLSGSIGLTDGDNDLFVPSEKLFSITFTVDNNGAAAPEITSTTPEDTTGVESDTSPPVSDNTPANNTEAAQTDFTPVTITGVAPAGSATPLPGSPAVTTFANESTAEIEGLSETQFRVVYDLSTPDSFAGAIINYAETPEGSADLNTLNDFVFNLSTDNNCISSQCAKIEFVDVNNEMSVILVNSLDTTPREVFIPKQALLDSNPGIDLTSVRQINFVLEERNTDPDAGFLEVQTGGL